MSISNVNKFFGTIAGDQKTTIRFGRQTYSRDLNGALPPFCVEGLRKEKLLWGEKGFESYKEAGEEYRWGSLRMTTIFDIQFFGVCYDYALCKILKAYERICIAEHKMICNRPEILEKYFTPTIDPKSGDMAVYSEYGKCVHYGVVIGDNLIESK